MIAAPSTQSLVAGSRWLARHVGAALLALCLVVAAVGAARAADDFLEPAKAFQFSARLLDANRVEASYVIAPGYYLYREQFRFAADGATLGDAAIPAGKVKFDENFKKTVETYHDEVRIVVPVRAAAAFTLRVTSQGCADAGLCYPPMTSVAQLDPAIVSAAQPGAVRTDGASSLTGGLLAAWRDGTRVDRVLQGGRVWSAVGVFFAMGLLLSLTPCVLPMLPILSSIIIGTNERPSRMRGLALASSYSLGMALVYTGLGVAAGMAGEGFAAVLQTPWAIGGFALLLAVFALSMFDVYELRLPARFMSRMSDHCNRLPAGQVAGVFTMGALSALIVSPCVTAPLAGALVFISQSRDMVLGGAALFAMALGMSVPLLLLGFSAGQWLPKSGPWMHAVKRMFGVLMLAVAIWIAQPVLPVAVVLGLWGLLLLVLGFMLRPFESVAHHHNAPRVWAQRALGVAALSIGVMQIVGAASGGRDPLQPLAHLGGAAATVGGTPVFRAIRGTQELDDVLRTAGRPVVLDFYADWCVSCKEMERFTFADAAVASRLSKAVLLRADVTANSEVDRALLRRFKLFGPPVILFFDEHGQEISSARVVGFQGSNRFGETLVSAGL